MTNTGGGWVKCETHALSGEARHEDAEGLLFYRITEGVSWREPREPEFRGVSWGGGGGGGGAERRGWRVHFWGVGVRRSGLIHGSRLGANACG